MRGHNKDTDPDQRPYMCYNEATARTQTQTKDLICVIMRPQQGHRPRPKTLYVL